MDQELLTALLIMENRYQMYKQVCILVQLVDRLWNPNVYCKELNLAL